MPTTNNVFPPPAPLTRADLDRAVSQGGNARQTEQAGPLWLSPRCHPRTPVHVLYDWTNGTITLVCGECQGLVHRIAVAHAEAAVTLT